MANFKAGIVGATGYTGSELVRLLTYHPDVDIEVLTSESKAGQRYSDLYPQYRNFADQKLETMDSLDKHRLDVVFLALPHTVSMNFVKEKGLKNYKIIDLSADFRLNSKDIYEKWYGTKHVFPGGIKKAVYGMPELFRNKVRRANFVANPGCYPTSAILALAPLMKNGLIKNDPIFVDSKSGVTGAGAKAKDSTHFPEVFGNFSAYKLLSHRHTPEIMSALKEHSGKNPKVLFTPHLLPIDRGILTTTYTKPLKPVDEEMLQGVYDTFYKKEHFVRVTPTPPSVKDVRGSNFCDVHVTYDERTNTIVTVSVIDNLVKGASGQAIQNMNIMLDMIETTGLKALPLSP